MHKRGLKRKEFSDLGTLLAEVGITPARAERFIAWHVKRAGKWDASKHEAIIRAIQSLYYQKRNAIIRERKGKD